MKQTFHPVKSYGSPFILALDILFILNPKRGNVFFLVKLGSTVLSPKVVALISGTVQKHISKAGNCFSKYLH